MIAEKDEILSAFSCGKNATLKPLGQGNINATYLVESVESVFVLQRISGEVFPDPEIVVKNFVKISTHIKSKTGADGGLLVSSPIYTRDGDMHYNGVGGGVWRAQEYIHTVPASRITTRNQAISVGAVLGTFHHLVRDLDSGAIADPLPGFHHLSSYLNAYDSSLHLQSAGPSDIGGFCRQTIERYRQSALRLEDAIRSGEVQSQPVHGDPKVDNFIFDDSGKALGLLDLDTVGRGIVFHDLGDCLRSACNTLEESAGEDEIPDFHVDFCRGVLEGYFSSEAGRIGEDKLGYIYDGLLAICFELGLRFFTDHLRGNTYFRVRKENENLIRARSQFLLCEAVIRRRSQILDTLFSLYKTAEKNRS